MNGALSAAAAAAAAHMIVIEILTNDGSLVHSVDNGIVLSSAVRRTASEMERLSQRRRHGALGCNQGFE